MALFTILQNKSNWEHHDEINQLGWDKAEAKYPGIAAQRTMSCGFGEIEEMWNPEFYQYYTEEATVDIHDGVDGPIEALLEIVFHASNVGHVDADYVNKGRAHSLSVGDLVKTPAGDVYAVCGVGFAKVSV